MTFAGQNFNDQGLRFVCKVLWYVFMLSLLSFSLVTHLMCRAGVGPGIRAAAAGRIDQVTLIFTVVACVGALLAWWLRRSALSSCRDTHDPVSVARLFVPFLVSMVLHETIIILGFVLTLLSRQEWRLYPFLVPALVLNVLIYNYVDKNSRTLG